MAIIGEAVASAIDANWNVVSGGTKPSIISYMTGYTERDPNPTDADAVFVYLPLPGTFKQVNDAYRNAFYTVTIQCQTSTSSARQVIIENEVIRIFGVDGVLTGVSQYYVTDKNDISNRSYGVHGPKYISEVRLEVISYMESGATAYGSASVSSLTVDTLTVNTSIAGNPTAALGATTVTGDIVVSGTVDGVDIAARDHAKYNSTDLETDLGITVAKLLDVAMYGSANAAWVPCMLHVESSAAKLIGGASWSVAAADGTDFGVIYLVPMPMAKGSLKLYISGVRIVINAADANDYITRIRVTGVTYNSLSTFGDVSTDRTAPGLYTSSLTATDCSGFNEVVLYVEFFNTTTQELQVRGVDVQCYYDT